MDQLDDLKASVNGAVRRSLVAELGARDLLLNPGELATQACCAARIGERLLSKIAREYLGFDVGFGDTLVLEVDGEVDPSRVLSTLAFGVSAGRLFGELSEDEELLCGTFNMVASQLDALCDMAPTTGGRLLSGLSLGDMAAVGALTDGWPEASRPPGPGDDPRVVFLERVIRGFFATLRQIPAVALRPVRLARLLGQLELAVEAERGSIAGASNPPAGLAPIDCSRHTSVLAIDIICTLAGGAGTEAPWPALGDLTGAAPTAGTLIGEATWVLDDMVDLVADAHSGALNAILLDVPAYRPGYGGRDRARSALEQILASEAIGARAAWAAERLAQGLALAGAPAAAQRLFLAFIQRSTETP